MPWKRRGLLEIFKEKKTMMAEATTVGPWPSPRPVVPTTAVVGPTVSVWQQGHLGFARTLGQQAPHAARGDPICGYLSERVPTFVSFHVCTRLSYPNRCLFRHLQPFINRGSTDTITKMKSMRVTAVLTLIKLEKTWIYIPVLSAFYPEDYLWYTANRSYEKWFSYDSLIYSVPQMFIRTLFPTNITNSFIFWAVLVKEEKVD